MSDFLIIGHPLLQRLVLYVMPNYSETKAAQNLLNMGKEFHSKNTIPKLYLELSFSKFRTIDKTSSKI